MRAGGEDKSASDCYHVHVTTVHPVLWFAFELAANHRIQEADLPFKKLPPPLSIEKRGF